MAAVRALRISATGRLAEVGAGGGLPAPFSYRAFSGVPGADPRAVKIGAAGNVAEHADGDTPERVFDYMAFSTIAAVGTAVLVDAGQPRELSASDIVPDLFDYMAF